MRAALILSGVLHIAIVLIALVGLPYLPKREMIQLAEIPVDVVEVGPMTISRLNDQPAERPRPQPPRPTPPKETPPPPPKAQERPEPPPPVREPEPPKPQPPKPEPPKPEPPNPEPPKEEPKPEPPKPEPPKPEPPKPEPPKPEPKKEPPKPEPKKEEPKRNLSDVLKNLERQKPPPSEAKPEPQREVAETPPGAIGPSGDRLTVGEEDALRAAIARLWAVPAGAKGVEDMVIQFRVHFDTTLRITRIDVIGGNGSTSDPHYRAFAESARRALDRLERLPIPAEKYANNRTIVVNFSPRDMF